MKQSVGCIYSNFPTKKPPESLRGYTVICQKYEIFNAQI